MWQNLGDLVTARAAEFWMSWRRLRFWAVMLRYREGYVKLGVVCVEAMVRGGSGNDCTQWGGVEDEEDGNKDGALWDAMEDRERLGHGVWD